MRFAANTFFRNDPLSGVEIEVDAGVNIAERPGLSEAFQFLALQTGTVVARVERRPVDRTHVNAEYSNRIGAALFTVLSRSRYVRLADYSAFESLAAFARRSCSANTAFGRSFVHRSYTACSCGVYP